MLKNMNKVILVILLVLCISNIYGMDIINFDMSVELGIIPGGTFKTYNFTRRVYDDLPLFGDFRFKVNMFNNHLYYGIGSKMIIWKVIDNKSFKPDSVNFLFFAGIRINDNVDIKYSHYCRHPILSWDNGSSTELEQSYDEISIKFSFNLFREENK